MAESAYIETSVISYLAARHCRDIYILACQQMTEQWWETAHMEFDLYVSERVIAETQAGDSEAAARRRAFLKGIPVLKVTDEATELSWALMARTGLPKKAEDDAVHIATAIVSGMNYLVTWNCKHIANGHIIPRIQSIATDFGYVCPTICTPQELTGVNYDVDRID